MVLTSRDAMRSYYNPYLKEVEKELSARRKGLTQYAIVINFQQGSGVNNQIQEIIDKYTALGWKIKVTIIFDDAFGKKVSFNFR